jgi:hypothetical protein
MYQTTVKVKKPNADIRGPCIVVPVDRREALAEYMALPLAVRQEVHELEYEQFNNNDVSYLGLQFFIAGLHPDIQLDVIKSGTADLYEAFKIAHACETAMQNKKIHSANDVAKVNELELDAVADPEEREAVEAVRRQFAQKRMCSANNGSAYQPRTGVQATTDPDQATATQTAARNPNPDNANQIQLSVRPVITVRRKTTSNPIALKERETMPQWYK